MEHMFDLKLHVLDFKSLPIHRVRNNERTVAHSNLCSHSFAKEFSNVIPDFLEVAQFNLNQPKHHKKKGASVHLSWLHAWCAPKVNYSIICKHDFKAIMSNV